MVKVIKLKQTPRFRFSLGFTHHIRRTHFSNEWFNTRSEGKMLP